MLYLNQSDYPHIPYITQTQNDSVLDKLSSVAKSGCGPCCLCMAVDALTTRSLSIEECVRLSEDCGANYGPGTDLSMLSPLVAERYGLEYRNTDDQAEMLACLQNGGYVVVNVKRQKTDEVGVFTNHGHYISAIATDGTEVCLLDPSYTPQKYHKPGREGKVNDQNAPFLYCHKDILHANTTWILPKYHLFFRKK